MAAFADLLRCSIARQALYRRDIAEVFRIFRDAGVSQASIALATGQRQSKVSEIISGRQAQSVVLLERIADELSVTKGLDGAASGGGPGPTRWAGEIQTSWSSGWRAGSPTSASGAIAALAFRLG